MSFFASQLVIGQYIPGESIVHRLNPFLKVLLTLAVMIGVFAFASWRHYAIFGAVWLVAYLAARLPFFFFVRGLRPILFLIGMTFFLHLFLTPGATVLAQAGPITITQEGLAQGVYFSVRLVLLVSFTSLLTLTTSTVELTFAIERLTKPLKRLGFPSEEFAMMLTIALRFIPVLFLELDKIVKAQRSRGVRFDRGGLKDRAQACMAILVPLFFNTFARALELATAMEVRCYEAGMKRGSLREHPFRAADALVTALFVGLAVLLARIH
jgi:energy-coupling factor transport system permease protein